jgi:hypothetical protein
VLLVRNMSFLIRVTAGARCYAKARFISAALAIDTFATRRIATADLS